jgi:ubiquinone/menaquinone biosynthesis C-methylase UbiE
MDRSLLEAVLYDWNNEQRLRDQLADVGYWRQRTSTLPTVLVVGCGTGRITRPLAESVTSTVWGIDLSLGRVSLAARESRARTVVADARALPFPSRSFAGVIFPYSTFQLFSSHLDRIASLSEASRAVRPEGTIWIDVSENFERRSTSPRRLVANGWSAVLGTNVAEWETLRRTARVLEIHKDFEIQGGPTFSTAESWVFASEIRLSELAEQLSLQLIKIERGYGSTLSQHRLIYAFQPTQAAPRSSIDLKRHVASDEL